MSSLPAAERLRWRVVIRTSGGLDAAAAGRPLAWHLAACVAPALPEAHCREGQRRLAAGGDPDGHCLIDAACPRCPIPDHVAAGPPASLVAV
jgi:hypothetical protein